MEQTNCERLQKKNPKHLCVLHMKTYMHVYVCVCACVRAHQEAPCKQIQPSSSEKKQVKWDITANTDWYLTDCSHHISPQTRQRWIKPVTKKNPQPVKARLNICLVHLLKIYLNPPLIWKCHSKSSRNPLKEKVRAWNMENTADGERGAFTRVLQARINWGSHFKNIHAVMKGTKENLHALLAAQKYKTRVITVTWVCLLSPRWYII